MVKTIVLTADELKPHFQYNNFSYHILDITIVIN